MFTIFNLYVYALYSDKSLNDVMLNKKYSLFACLFVCCLLLLFMPNCMERGNHDPKSPILHYPENNLIFNFSAF